MSKELTFKEKLSLIALYSASACVSSIVVVAIIGVIF